MSERLPSFSVVLETENLANVPAEALSACLDRLARQDISPALANEVLLIQSGDVPASLLTRLRSRYPWLSICQSDAETEYYAAKMAGARRATGDVVVFCDADCQYGPEWLRHLLLPFIEDSVQVVAGETSLRVGGPYSLAVLLAWAFPPFSRRRNLYPSPTYQANNVAFRRQLLLRYPIPCGLPMYRGSGHLHAMQLRRLGVVIWKQPKARVTHPVPTHGAAAFFWRWLLYGHDQVVRERLALERSAASRRVRWRPALLALVGIVSSGTWKPLHRLPAVLRDDPKRLLVLPVALGIVWSMVTLALAGWVLGLLRPGRIVGRGAESLKDAHGTARLHEATAA